LEQTDPRTIETLLGRNPPFGNELKSVVAALPKFDMSVAQTTTAIHNTLGTEIRVHVTRINETPPSSKASRVNHSIVLIGTSTNLFLYRRFSSFSQREWEFSCVVDSQDPIVNVCLLNEEYIGLDKETKITLHSKSDPHVPRKVPEVGNNNNWSQKQPQEMNQGTKSRKKGVKKQRCSQAKVSKNRNFLEEVSPNSPQKQFASTTYYEQNYEPTRRANGSIAKGQNFLELPPYNEEEILFDNNVAHSIFDKLDQNNMHNSALIDQITASPNILQHYDRNKVLNDEVIDSLHGNTQNNLLSGQNNVNNCTAPVLLTTAATAIPTATTNPKNFNDYNLSHQCNDEGITKPNSSDPSNELRQNLKRKLSQYQFAQLRRNGEDSSGSQSKQPVDCNLDNLTRHQSQKKRQTPLDLLREKANKMTLPNINVLHIPTSDNKMGRLLKEFHPPRKNRIYSQRRCDCADRTPPPTTRQILSANILNRNSFHLSPANIPFKTISRSNFQSFPSFQSAFQPCSASSSRYCVPQQTMLNPAKPIYDQICPNFSLENEKRSASINNSFDNDLSRCYWTSPATHSSLVSLPKIAISSIFQPNLHSLALPLTTNSTSSEKEIHATS